MPIIANLPGTGSVWLAGDTHQFEIAVVEEGAPLDLTVFDEAVFSAKLDKTDSDNAFTTIQHTLIDGGVEFTDIPGGIITVTIEADDTKHLEKDTTYFWDVQIKDTSDGEVITIASGTMSFVMDVTQQ